MFSILSILALLAAPVVPLSHGPVPSGDSAPVQCCCCPAGSCSCGCEIPGPPTAPGETPAKLCGCDDTPLGLPGAGFSVDQLRVAGESLPSVHDLMPDSGDHAGRIVCRTHDPPAALALVSTVVILC